jgi:YggT family protein
MFVISNFLAALGSVLNIFLSVYMWIVIARAVISWVNPDPYNPIVRFLHAATDPVMYRVRRLLPVYFGGIDFSPILVIVAIIFLQSFLVQSLFDLSRALR